MGFIEDAAAIKAESNLNVREKSKKHSIKRFDIAKIFDDIIDLIGVVYGMLSLSYPEAGVISWSEMDNSGNEGRFILNKPEWKGFDPLICVDNSIWLIFNEDYILLEDGGIRLLSFGNVPYLYDQEVLHAVSFRKKDYEPIDPVQPPAPTNISINQVNNIITFTPQEI